MLVIPNQVFLDGGDRYEPGQEYEVPDDLGGYFVSHGWASSPDLPDVIVPDPPELVEVQPRDSSSSHYTEVL